MQGVERQATHDFTEFISGASWRLVGTHDFDGDRKTDLLKQHLSQGWILLTLLDGLDPKGTVLVDPPREPDLDWQVVGTGDIDLDGQADLLWRNLADGRLRVWLMNGTVRREEIALLDAALPGVAWRVAAVEDLNRDGRLDVVFRHEVLGLHTVGLMNGPRFVGALPMTPAMVNPQWRVAASGDLGGDGGTADLVWRHGPTGSLRAAFLEGARITGTAPLDPPSVPSPTRPGSSSAPAEERRAPHSSRRRAGASPFSIRGRRLTVSRRTQGRCRDARRERRVRGPLSTDTDGVAPSQGG
jgi:hypothetical protein